MWTVLLLPFLAAPPAAEQPVLGTSRIVAIDSDWLKSRGPGPYLLKQPRTTYLLKNDVRTSGTAFVVDAPDITLDLGGRQIVYGDSPPLVVTNFSFEEGSGRDVPGWDLQAAPAAQIGPNIHCLFGKQVLQFKDFRTTQKLVSAPIAVTSSRHTHVATITPAGGDYRTALTLKVVDADTNQILGQGKSNNVERGISAVAHFQPGTAKSIRLVVEATPGEGRSDNLDLDYATVAPSYDYGILATNAWSGEVPGWKNVEAMVGKQSRQVSNLLIRNGEVRQGKARGLGSSPLLLTQVRGLAVANVELFTNGMDTTTLSAAGCKGPVQIHGCTFRHDVENITDRSKLTAAISLASVTGAIDIDGNEFRAVPQVGILLDKAGGGERVHVHENRIQQKTVVTNGYAILIVGTSNFEIDHNHIVAENGRGIDIDSYRKDPVAHGTIHHNEVDVQEKLNREDWQHIEARALRLRNTVDGRGPHRDLLIHDNTFIAHTGDGLAQKAFGLRVSYQNGDGSLNGANVRLERNTFRAFTTSTDPTSRASAVALDGLDRGADIRFVDNILESNDTALTLADGQGPVHGLDWQGNTFRKLDRAGPTRTFHAIHAGFWEFPVRDVLVTGPRLDNGATADIEWNGSGRKDLALGWLVNVQVRNGNGPIAAADVTITDREGKVVHTGKTDSNGALRNLAVIAVRYQQTTGDARKIVADERGPFQVRAVAGSQSVTERIAIQQNQDVTLRFPAR